MPVWSFIERGLPIRVLVCTKLLLNMNMYAGDTSDTRRRILTAIISLNSSFFCDSFWFKTTCLSIVEGQHSASTLAMLHWPEIRQPYPLFYSTAAASSQQPAVGKVCTVRYVRFCSWKCSSSGDMKNVLRSSAKRAQDFFCSQAISSCSRLTEGIRNLSFLHPPTTIKLPWFSFLFDS
jgi:hypothetical protein